MATKLVSAQDLQNWAMLHGVDLTVNPGKVGTGFRVWIKGDKNVEAGFVIYRAPKGQYAVNTEDMGDVTLRGPDANTPYATAFASNVKRILLGTFQIRTQVKY